MAKRKNLRRTDVRKLRVVEILNVMGYIFLIFMSIVMIMEISVLRNFAVGTFQSQEIRLLRMYKQRQYFTKVLREADGSPFGMKYKNYPVARLCHMLPGLIWAVLGPLQFSSRLRRKYGRMHRILGRVFLSCSLLIAVGLCSIIYHKLTFYKAGFFDFMFLSVMNSWFTVTGYLGISYARCGNIKKHRVWILRHCASGYFVFLHRIIMLLTRSPLINIGFDLTISENAKVWFHICALVAAGVSITSIEFWIYLCSENDMKGFISLSNKKVSHTGTDFSGKHIQLVVSSNFTKKATYLAVKRPHTFSGC